MIACLFTLFLFILIIFLCKIKSYQVKIDFYALIVFIVLSYNEVFSFLIWSHEGLMYHLLIMADFSSPGPRFTIIS